MSLVRVLICAVALAVLTGASPEAGEERSGRFVLTPVEGGFLRMDTQTGAVSMCQKLSNKWACEAVADDRRSLETEIERLTSENRELSRQLDDQLGLGEPDGKDKRANRSRPKFQLPSEEEVDRALTYMQSLMRKFKEKMQELESDKDRRSL